MLTLVLGYLAFVAVNTLLLYFAVKLRKRKDIMFELVCDEGDGEYFVKFILLSPLTIVLTISVLLILLIDS